MRGVMKGYKRVVLAALLVMLSASGMAFGGTPEARKFYDDKKYDQFIKEAQAVIADESASKNSKLDMEELLIYHYLVTGQNEKSITECQRVLQDYPEAEYQGYRANAQSSLARSYGSIGKDDLALAEWQKAIDTYPDDSGLRAVALGAMARIYLGRKEYEKCLTILRSEPYISRSVGPYPQYDTYVCVRELKKGGNDALLEAKLYYDMVSFDMLQAGIDAVCEELKAIDMNFDRANRFMEYQRTGTGENPVAKLTVSAERKTFYDDLIKKYPDDYYGLKNQMYFYLLSGDANQALQTAKKVYAKAAPNQATEAVMSVAVCLKALDGNIIRASAFIDSQNTGKPFELP